MKNINFKNSKFLQPLTGKKLTNELKKHDIYITASQNEPSGNHHMEGALCGLPILFKDSGATPEYCNEFGLIYDIKNFRESLVLISKNYDKFVLNLERYPYDFLNAAQEFNKIFEESHKQKIQIINSRNLRSKPNIFIRYLLNKLFTFFYNKYFSLKKILGRTKYTVNNVTKSNK